MKTIKSILIWSFVWSITILGYSQTAPGGVKGSQAWFKTDRLANGYFKWQDFSGDGVQLNHWNSTNEYLNGGRYFNFNAALYFDGGSREFFLNQTNLQQGTIIGLFGYTATYFNYETILFGIKGRPNEGVLITNDKIVNSAERDGEILDYGEGDGEDLRRKSDNSEGTDAKYRERSLKIVSYYQYQQPNSSVWGEDSKASLTLGYGYLNNVNGLSTYNMSNFGNNFYGYIPELLVYSRVLNPLERRKAETYLAIKYGVSLSNSYIGSDGKLLWDYSANTAYNHRINGIMRDDISGLNQAFSTTSYEENPYFTDAYDSYQDQNTREKSSRYRLLAMGQSTANELEDKSTTLWGDDNGALSTQDTGNIAGINRMIRTWKLVTNTLPPTAEQSTLTFNSNGLEVDSKFGKSNFTNIIANSTGTSVTSIPLQGKNGYLEFKPQVLGSTIVVKFGAQNGIASTSDYGLRIDPNGATYTLENTKAPVYIGTIAANHHKLTIEKKGDVIYVNSFEPHGNKAIGTRTLIVLPQDADKDMYGVVSLEKKAVDYSLGVAHGGFVATGSLVELSFDGYRATEFESYRDRAFLIIDRSGTGSFGIDHVDYYPLTDIDKTRYKIIFNNVIWDTDGNGKDVFTFGYKKDTKLKLVAIEEAIDPTCVDGMVQKDGKIDIEVIAGLPGYKYTLNKSGIPTSLQSGTFYESKKTLTDLEAGDYELTLEMIGTNFEKTAGTNLAAVASTTAMSSPGSGSLEFAVIEFPSDRYIGFISQRATPTVALLNYGVQIKQNKLYFWNKGVAGTTALANLSTGSIVKLQIDNGLLQCYVDGMVVGTQNLATADVGLSYFGFVGLDGTINGIYNLVHSGFVTSPTKLVWGTASNLNISEGDGVNSKLTHKITLTAPQCEEIIPPVVEPIVTDNVTVAPVPSKAGANFNIYVELNNPSEVMVLIFNTRGTLIKELRHGDLQKSHTFTTSISTAGVYILKILTSDGEFSKSIIIN